jgi:hypothetical protein
VYGFDVSEDWGNNSTQNIFCAISVHRFQNFNRSLRFWSANKLDLTAAGDAPILKCGDIVEKSVLKKAVEIWSLYRFICEKITFSCLGGGAFALSWLLLLQKIIIVICLLLENNWFKPRNLD